MLHRFLAPYAPASYAILRIFLGLSFAFHGMQKIFGVFAKLPTEFGTQMWWGGFIELVTGLLIAVGWRTTEAAFLASGTMAVAYIQFHWKFAWDENFFPGLNEGEHSLLFAFPFLYVACFGAGKWSWEHRRARS